MVTRINEWKTLANHISCECNSDQWWINFGSYENGNVSQVLWMIQRLRVMKS